MQYTWETSEVQFFSEHVHYNCAPNILTRLTRLLSVIGLEVPNKYHCPPAEERRLAISISYKRMWKNYDTSVARPIRSWDVSHWACFSLKAWDVTSWHVTWHGQCHQMYVLYMQAYTWSIYEQVARLTQTDRAMHALYLLQAVAIQRSLLS